MRSLASMNGYLRSNRNQKSTSAFEAEISTQPSSNNPKFKGKSNTYKIQKITPPMYNPTFPRSTYHPELRAAKTNFNEPKQHVIAVGMSKSYLQNVISSISQYDEDNNPIPDFHFSSSLDFHLIGTAYKRNDTTYRGLNQEHRYISSNFDNSPFHTFEVKSLQICRISYESKTRLHSEDGFDSINNVEFDLIVEYFQPILGTEDSKKVMIDFLRVMPIDTIETPWQKKLNTSLSAADSAGQDEYFETIESLSEADIEMGTIAEHVPDSLVLEALKSVVAYHHVHGSSITFGPTVAYNKIIESYENTGLHKEVINKWQPMAY